MKRLLWWALLVAIAFVTVCVQFDRESARTPAFALAVPSPFRANAQFAHAGIATMTAEPQAAVREARTLVRRRPIPADHLFLLALARLRAGDTAGFEKTISLATERGWRSEGVQLIAARSAIQQRDADAAANRIVALHSIGSRSPELAKMTRAALELPEGPETIGTRLASGGERGARLLHAIVRGAGDRNAERLFAAAARECSAEREEVRDCTGFEQPDR